MPSRWCCSVVDVLRVKQLGIQPYEPVWQAMRDFTDQRDKTTPDECWLLEHEPVLTLGQAGKESHIIGATGIPVVHADRGGQVTYHGPGQLVMYWLVDLKRRNLGVKAYVGLIEQAIIAVLGDYGIEASLREGAPGVYVGNAKIASLGLRVRKGCSYHGLALNVSTDLSAFHAINPCGYQGLEMVNLNQLVNDETSCHEAGERVLTVMADLLDYQQLERCSD